MVNETVILKVIADLKMQIKLNYNVRFKKYKINCKMLQRYFKNKIIPKNII